MTDEIEQEVERRVAAATRRHSLQQAHQQVREATLILRNVKYLIPDETDLVKLIDNAINQGTDRAAWHIEQAVIAASKEMA